MFDGYVNCYTVWRDPSLYGSTTKLPSRPQYTVSTFICARRFRTAHILEPELMLSTVLIRPIMIFSSLKWLIHHFEPFLYMSQKVKVIQDHIVFPWLYSTSIYSCIYVEEDSLGSTLSRLNRICYRKTDHILVILLV